MSSDRFWKIFYYNSFVIPEDFLPVLPEDFTGFTGM